MSSLVSIIIPCYNSESWIAEAIRSSLEQTWECKEVLVIDDGSTDHSLEIIKSFGETIRWVTGPNRGGCAARNRGVDLARGGFIQFLDSDDVLVSDCVASKMNTILGSCDRVCCGVELWAEVSTAAMVDYWDHPLYDLESMIRTGTPATPGPLHLRSDLIAVGGFREDLRCSQEYDLHLRLASELGIRFVSNGKIGAKIRRREGSVSKSVGTHIFIVSAEILIDLWNRLQHRREVDKEIMAAVISHRLTGIARTLYRRGACQQASSLAKTAQAIHPSWHKTAYRTQIGGLLANLVGFEMFEKLHRLVPKK